jgi:hypothetical protein
MKDVHVKITQQDKNLLDNLLKMLGRAKMELEGVEILAAADSMRWLSRLSKQIEEESKKPDIQITNTEPITKPKPQKPVKK